LIGIKAGLLMTNSHKFIFAYLSSIPMYSLLSASEPRMKLCSVVGYLVIISQNSIILIQNMKKGTLRPLFNWHWYTDGLVMVCDYRIQVTLSIPIPAQQLSRKVVLAFCRWLS
jgi:hypothetical protein